jgi:hypothetical protein
VIVSRLWYYLNNNLTVLMYEDYLLFSKRLFDEKRKVVSMLNGRVYLH